MNLRKVFLLCAVPAALAIQLAGVRWGLPGPAVAKLVMPGELNTPEFLSLIAATREDIYKHSGNSPLGRLRISPGDGETPLMRSLNVSPDRNIRVGRDKVFLANLVRPYLVRSSHSDEQMTLASLAGMKPGKLDFNPRLFQYGGAYIYGVGAFLYLNKLAGLVELTPDIKYYFSAPGKMGDIFAAARIYSAIFCLLSLVPIYLIAKRRFSPFVAGITAGMLAVCPAIVLESHIVKPYCMASFFAIMCVYYSLLIMEKPQLSRYHILAGVFFGLTSGSMPFYGMVLVSPALAYLFIRKRAGIFLFALGGVCAFVATNPYWLLAFKDVSFELLSFGSGKLSGNIYDFFQYFYGQMPLGLHWLTLVVMAFGMAAALPGRDKRDIVLITSAVLPIIVAAWMFKTPMLSMLNSRFLLPWLSLGMLYFSRFIEYLYLKPGFKKPALLLLTLALGANIMGTSVLLANFRAGSSDKSAHFLAGRWINDNIRPGAGIGLFAFPQPGLCPPFNFGNYEITIMLKCIDPRVEYIVTTEELHADNFVAAAKYLPVESVMGWRHYMRNSPVNPPAFIYKRVSGPESRSSL